MAVTLEEVYAHLAQLSAQYTEVRDMVLRLSQRQAEAADRATANAERAIAERVETAMNVKAIMKSLDGNGAPGLTQRVTALEMSRATTDERHAITGAIGGRVAAVLGGILVGVMGRLLMGG